MGLLDKLFKKDNKRNFKEMSLQQVFCNLLGVEVGSLRAKATEWGLSTIAL